MRTVALALLAGSAFAGTLTFNRSSLNPLQAANLRRAQAAFDSNHNGKLEPEELDALMQFLQRSVK